jgi:hypothetical protein
MKRALTILILFLAFIPNSTGWGFYAHKKINRNACFTLPSALFPFYKYNINEITERAVNPDKRRGLDPNEEPKHYIDIDHYGAQPFDSVPQYWFDAVTKFSEDTLKEYGTLPWNLQLELYNLTEAFKIKDRDKIIKHSADIGHYIGDAHVPLHTTENYNGHLTNQRGIHGFWESRLPELYADNYNLLVGRASYLEQPLLSTWEIIQQSNLAVDSVLKFEAELTKEFGSKKYSFEKRGKTSKKVYSEAFSSAYHSKLSNMVERRLKASIHMTASFWLTAWVNAGQPDLLDLIDMPIYDSTANELQKLELEYKIYHTPKREHE